MTIQIAPPPRSQLAQKVHCFAHLWKVERTDGLGTLRLTDHSRIVPYFETSAYFDYTPIGGFGSSAQERAGGLDDQNLEGFGEVSIAAITDDDLRAGRYREAKVTAYVIDWRFPWLGPIETQVFWFVDATYDQEKWRVQLSGIPSWLRYPCGQVYTRTCDNDLFDAKCVGGDAPFIDRNLLTAFLCDVSSVGLVDRANFQATGSGGGLALSTTATGYFNLGKLTWKSGSNVGIVSEVKSFTNDPSSSRSIIELQLPVPFDIQENDLFDMEAGCDKLWDTCKTKFPDDNTRNFSGHRFIPGTDKQIQNASPI